MPNQRDIEKSQVVPSELASAVRSAIEESNLAADSLEAQVVKALGALQSVMRENDDSADSPEAVRSLRQALQTAHSDAADLFERQKAALATVNIALFGRTQVGKSSLIEAISCGSGETISTGECDFTLEVQPTTWKGVQFFDTPGINGWGRTVSREVLESRTRKAVEVADMVVLCFDDHSQQASEFEKIAAWVKEYGKPVVCVLNMKNSAWRNPEMASSLSRRRILSQGVRENVSNIETEFAAIDITRVPIVAICAQRAVYARTGEYYSGPLPEQCRKMRELLDCDELLRQSNLEVFERVVGGALTDYAIQIRLGMLHSQVRTLLERLLLELQQAKEAANKAVDALDVAVGGIMEIVGYPPQGSAMREALPKTSSGEDILTAAEKARGDPFSAGAEGRVRRFSRRRCNSGFGALRSKSIAAANKAINDSFDRRCNLEAEDFVGQVYDMRRIKETGESVLTVAAEYLERELKLALDDAKLDLEFAVHEAEGITGGAGKVMRGAGILANIASILAGVATVAAFTPEPVITKGVALILGVTAGVLKLVGGWLTGKAKAKRQKARTTALAEATRGVNKTYDEIADQVEASVETMVRDAGAEALAVPLQNATGLWCLSSVMTVDQEILARSIEAVPEAIDAQALIDQSARKVAEEQGFFDRSSEADQLLLGEDWLCDPDIVEDEAVRVEPIRTAANDPGIFERMFSGFHRFTVQFTGNIRRGSGTDWLAQSEALLSGDEAGTAALAEVRQMESEGKPRYHFLGDYSTGKTSFIKRLLIDAGQSLPPTLEVRADPVTDRVHSYTWEDSLLIDSPGLQSSKADHADLTLKSVPDASVVICLFQPNLLVGHTAPLECVLKGDQEKGLAAKLDRTIFVIHRADELSPNPDLIPEQYVRACQNKRFELQKALASRGMLVEIDRIICMAADPYQMVGNRRDVNSAEFNRFRKWDGFKEFHAAIREIHSDSATSALDYSILEGGLARLGQIDSELALEEGALKFRKNVFARQASILADITSTGELLEGDLTAQAQKLVEDYVQGLMSQETRSDEELRTKVAALAKWWVQPDFVARVDHWQTQAQKQIESWWRNSAERLARTMSSPRFKAALAGATEKLDETLFESSKTGHLKESLGIVADGLKGATRDLAYASGKMLGRNFRPWGAVNLAKNLRGAGAGLSGLLAAWDVYSLFKFFKEEKNDEQRQKEMNDFMDQTTEQVFISITTNGNETTGPLELLRLLKKELQGVAKELEMERDSINERFERLYARRLRYRKSMSAAWEALGQNPPSNS